MARSNKQIGLYYKRKAIEKKKQGGNSTDVHQPGIVGGWKSAAGRRRNIAILKENAKARREKEAKVNTSVSTSETFVDKDFIGSEKEKEPVVDITQETVI